MILLYPYMTSYDMTIVEGKQVFNMYSKNLYLHYIYKQKGSRLLRKNIYESGANREHEVIRMKFGI